MPLTVDDAQLLRMASEPPRDAARMLSRSVSFAPLAVFVAVLLPWLAAACASFDTEAAIWGIKALGVAQAAQIDQVLIPGLGWRADGAIFQPPLQAWLTGLVLPVLPEGAAACLFFVSVASLPLGTWAGSRWVRQTVGPIHGLMLIVFLTTHPQWLAQAGSGGPEAVTLCLLLAVGCALWSHWRHSTTLVSVWLLAAGIAWGLALLAGGVVAIVWLALVGMWMLVRPDSPEALDVTPAARQSRHGWSLAIVFATGMAIGGWWCAMMLNRFGLDFLHAWLTHDTELGQNIARVDRTVWRQGLVAWTRPLAFISGFLLLGASLGLRGLLRRERTADAQMAGFMFLWLAIGMELRLLPGLFPEFWGGQSTRTWESFCVVPTAYLTAHGLVCMAQRRVSTRVVQTCLTVTVGFVAWSLSLNWKAGLLIGGVVGLLFALSAPLAVGLRRTSLAWSEPEIRRWIQGFGLVAFLGHALGGSPVWWATPSGRPTYEATRLRLSRLTSPQQISVITSEVDDDPAQLEYMLRSLFPGANWSHSIGWDPALTKTILTEFQQPMSRMLVVEWSRRELRVGGDVGTGWHVTPVLEPIPYRGRRLAALMIEPEARPTDVEAVPEPVASAPE